MKINIDRDAAVEKLQQFFGQMDLIEPMHTIAVELSKYIIILLFAIYTWHCFTVFVGKNKERKDKIYRIQKKMIFIIHFICTLVLFLNCLDVKIVLLYFFQVVFLVFVSEAYPFVYNGMSRLLMNNMLMLLMIGFVMIERLNMNSAIRQLIFASAICFVGLFIPLLIDKFRYFDRLGWIYALCGIVMLALVFVIGQEKYGAKNWIILGGIALQPSEFAKILFVFFAAALLAKTTDFKHVVLISGVVAVHVLILVAEKDLGAALLFYITFLFLLYVASENIGYLFAGILAGSGAAVAAYHLFSHVQTRVIAWRDPWSTIDHQGYQVAQSLFAIGTGGWFGMGFGEGLPRTIPVSSTDFIFSAIAEEFGVIFAVCLLLVEVSCFIMTVNIALKMTRRFYKLSALGFSVEFAFQVFLTVGGAIKFIPSTGVTLPLVSYGGSSVISMIVVFHIIQGMYVLNQEEVEKSEREEKQTSREDGEV